MRPAKVSVSAPSIRRRTASASLAAAPGAETRRRKGREPDGSANRLRKAMNGGRRVCGCADCFRVETNPALGGKVGCVSSMVALENKPRILTEGVGFPDRPDRLSREGSPSRASDVAVRSERPLRSDKPRSDRARPLYLVREPCIRRTLSTKLPSSTSFMNRSVTSTIALPT